MTQYATFTYDDTDAVASEIDEIYSFHERHAFAEHARTWRAHFPAGLEWDSAGADAQDSFVADCLAAVALPPSDRTAAAAACLVHIAHGTYARRGMPLLDARSRLTHFRAGEEGLRTGVFTEGMPQEVQLARMADEGARLCRLGAHRTIGAALAAVHGARDWAALSLLLQVLCLQCLAGRRDAAFAASLALPLPDGTTLVRTLFELLGETQEQIPKGFPFKKVGPSAGARTSTRSRSPLTVVDGPLFTTQLILTLWRVMLVAWGDFAALPLLRDVARAEAGLPPLRQGGCDPLTNPHRAALRFLHVLTRRPDVGCGGQGRHTSRRSRTLPTLKSRRRPNFTAWSAQDRRPPKRACKCKLATC